VVVGYLDIETPTLAPAKANPPLFIHPNAVLTRSITLELLQSIAWRHPELLERLRRVEHYQFPLRQSLNGRG
jgi:hypothetical protein